MFPPSLGGRLSVLFQILRQVSLIFSTSVFSSEMRQLKPDVFFVDQLSACIPLFRLLHPNAKVLFYGHYPDLLLETFSDFGLMKKIKQIYRLPFDALEGWSTGCADTIVVNSKFTRAVFKAVFRHMRPRDLKVIYPCVDTEQIELDAPPIWPDKKIMLSINRFEGKKNLALAIRAYAGLTADERKKAKLVMAGGWDPRAPENAYTHNELQRLTESLNLTHATFANNDTLTTDMTTDDVDALFLLSIPHELKQKLLQQASLMVYTPKDEHFGIVPLEAMLAGVPVLATNTGGPLETIYDGRTGWLRSPDKVEQWTEVMRKPLIPSNEQALKAMGQRGRERVMSEFSHTKMTEAFDQEVQKLVASTSPRPHIMPDWLLAFAVVTVIAIIAAVIGMKITVWAVNLEETRHLDELAANGGIKVHGFVPNGVPNGLPNGAPNGVPHGAPNGAPRGHEDL